MDGKDCDGIAINGTKSNNRWRDGIARQETKPHLNEGKAKYRFVFYHSTGIDIFKSW